MKVQCAQCREVVPLGRFAIAGSAIELTCPECKATYRVSAETGARIDPEPSRSPPEAAVEGRVGGVDCPKCDRLVPDGAEACAACGLRRDRFAEFAAAQLDEPAEVAAAWTACRDRWDDPAAHDRFLDATAAAQAFGPAARHYRDVLRERPGDERARHGLDRVTRMAEATLLGTASARLATPAEPEPYKNVVLMLLVLVALGGIFGIYALFRAKDADPEPPGPKSLRERRAPIEQPVPHRRR